MWIQLQFDGQFPRRAVSRCHWVLRPELGIACLIVDSAIEQCRLPINATNKTTTRRKFTEKFSVEKTSQMFPSSSIVADHRRFNAFFIILIFNFLLSSYLHNARVDSVNLDAFPTLKTDGIPNK